ncbi:hypothetical protein [uncultured Traorella sp.]|uniref:hypothetical protein n=1 Tax=uncultured Traorella sp. TaxID=1929048 RepID=UPI0025DFE273|nr:hypothetical protein [uncultured Traorella sp.]
MNIKKRAIRIAKKKIMRNKTASKTIKAVRISGCLLGGSFLTYMMASYGKKLSEQENIFKQ